MSYKPFDHSKMLNARLAQVSQPPPKVITRDGKEVANLTLFNFLVESYWVGSIGPVVYIWDKNGRIRYTTGPTIFEHCMATDLVFASEEKTIYLNVWINSIGGSISQKFSTEVEAREHEKYLICRMPAVKFLISAQKFTYEV